jgi:DNA-binding IclR family transcriptional regulator
MNTMYSHRIPSEETSGVRPLASALKILSLLDHLGSCADAVRLAELSRQLNLPRATLYQRLITLVEAGWVEQLEDGRFRLTLRAARLAKAATDQAGLGDRTLPILEALVSETGEAASLAVLENGEPRIIQRVEPRGILKVEMHVGAAMSLRESASGRVLVAFAAEHVLASLKAVDAALPDKATLQSVRQAGHSISSGRSIAGIRAAAVPVFDHTGRCVAALSLVAPTQRFAADGWIKPLREAAQRLSALMEGRIP